MARLKGATAASDTGDRSFWNVTGFWPSFFQAKYNWRWGGKPHLYFSAGQAYADRDEFVALDGLGRTLRSSRPFECIMDPFTGEFEELYVQAPDAVCALPNSTWRRTVIRSASPKYLRYANIPFQFIPKERRDVASRYTEADWWRVLALWIPSAMCVMLSMFTLDAGRPNGKEYDFYLRFMYSGSRYPRLARNFLENAPAITKRRCDDPSWSATALDTYRTLRPRYLCYIVEKDVQNSDGHSRTRRRLEVRPVTPDDDTPYVFIAYTTKHFDISEGSPDLAMLDAMALKATLRYAVSVVDPERKPRAFWLAHYCTPRDRYYGTSGQEEVVDENIPNWRAGQERLADHDVYSISDVIRGADHVIIVAGNRWREPTADPLREWGSRVWTLPEVLLSNGDTVTVISYDCQGPKLRTISKRQFLSLGWGDPMCSRQLLEHFTNLHLSRLELMKVALECLIDRKLKAKHPGDRSYALMGLLRIRPPIDRGDSSFQAFARLSLPQDSDRLMERLICLLPENPEEDWEKMSDRYKSSLWDIYPDTQVCGVGENDTVIVDGCKGAAIQWSRFSAVQTTKRMTLKRKTCLYLVLFHPLLFVVAVLLVIFYDRVGGPVIALTLILVTIPSPYYIWLIFSGKPWAVEPCLFGIEGYVPLDVIETKLFGDRLNRMSWSPYGSPLSRHGPGDPCRERRIQYSAADEERAQLNPPHVDTVDTFPVEAIDPCSPCPSCEGTKREGQRGEFCSEHETVASAHEKSRSAMGEIKVFTLVDTFSMTVTLFHAVRPPTCLVVGGSEGGMKRALACSYDIKTGALYRETVLRIPSQSASHMFSMPRIRLGLKRPFLPGDVRPRKDSE